MAGGTGGEGGGALHQAPLGPRRVGAGPEALCPPGSEPTHWRGVEDAFFCWTNSTWLGGALWGWTAGNGGRIRLSAPHLHCRVRLPQAGRWLFSRCVGQAGPLRTLTGGGDITQELGQEDAPGLGRGRRGKCARRPCT